MLTSDLIKILSEILDVYGDKDSGIYIEDFGFDDYENLRKRGGIIVQCNEITIVGEYE